MIHNELITIGITCFNAQDTLLRALKSALNQTWTNTEILLVDDASSDKSLEKIYPFVESNPHVKLIQHKSNLGPAAARQTIMKQSKGSFIAFFDDDDESLAARLEIQYKTICAYEKETGEDLIACYASGTRRYPNGYKMHIKAIGSQPEIPHGTAVADRLLFYGGDTKFFYGAGTPTCSLMARKSTLEAIGGFDADFRRVEDVDLAIRLSLSGGHFIGCPEALFIQYSSQSQDKAPEKNLQAELQLAEKHKNYLQSIGWYSYAKKWPLLRYYHFTRRYLSLCLVLGRLLAEHPMKTLSHFLTTAPKRFLHERKMKKRLPLCV